MPRPFALALALAATLVVTAQASAATRWASPTGSGAEPCNSRFPCTLKNAVANAPNDGDEVVLRTGEYAIGETLTADKKLNIHGEPGKPRPRLLPTQSFSGQTLYLYGSGPGEFRLSRLEIQSKSAALHVIGGPSFLQGLVLLGNGPGAAAALVEYDGVSVLRDTIARANGQGSVGVLAYRGPVHLRNVTAIATGSSAVGLKVHASCIPSPGGCMPPFTDSLMVARNVIARGAGHDLEASTGGAGPKAEIDIGHSNFVTSAVGDGAKITDAGGNQTAAPLFAD